MNRTTMHLRRVGIDTYRQPVVYMRATAPSAARRASLGGGLAHDAALRAIVDDVEAGERLTWGAPIVDRHCVGGLPGNRTTPIVVAIVAAAGWTIPKTSSRAITSPAGTADTMEQLAPVGLDIGTMRRVVEREGASSSRPSSRRRWPPAPRTRCWTCPSGPHGEGTERGGRHPIHVAVDLLVLGSTVWVGGAALWACVSSAFVAGDMRARVEERSLLAASSPKRVTL